jgi:PTS system mannose-specific IIB component
MITHLRIDNRLIHGQVAVGWLKYISAKASIVCNDKVANDPIQKMALPMAARGSNVLVFTIAETLKYEKEHQDENIFVIAKFPQDALDIMKTGVKIKEINVGNAAPIAGTKYVMVTKSIAATKEDAQLYKQIAEMNGGKLTSQIMPHNETSDFMSALRKSKLL